MVRLRARPPERLAPTVRGWLDPTVFAAEQTSGGLVPACGAVSGVGQERRGMREATMGR